MAISERDLEFISENIGRPPRGAEEVVARCPVGHPLAIRVRPVVENKPFPTLFWLVCRDVCKQIDHLESTGLIKQLERDIQAGEDFGLADDHLQYAQLRRDFMKQEDEDILNRLGILNSFSQLGVGGVADHQRIRCLHMHFGFYFAGQASTNFLRNTSLESKITLCN